MTPRDEAQAAATLHRAISEIIAPQPMRAAIWTTERTRLRGPYYVQRPALVLRDDAGETRLEVCVGAHRMDVTAHSLLGASPVAVYVVPDAAPAVDPEAAVQWRAAHLVQIMQRICALFAVSPPGDAPSYTLCMEW